MHHMTPEDQLEAVEQELRWLYARQTSSEKARDEGRVTDHAAWRQALAERAEWIRQLERQRDRMVAEEEAAAELREGHRQGEEP